MFRQYRRGSLADEVWEPYDRFIFGALQIEAVIGWWNSDGSLVSKQFRDHVDNLLKAPNETRWRPVSTADMVPDKK